MGPYITFSFYYSNRYFELKQKGVLINYSTKEREKKIYVIPEIYYVVTNMEGEELKK